MDVSKIVVVVEDVDAARTALQWALHNLVRYGDIITLLHVFPSTRSKSKKKARLLRLNGFQLALSFKDVCNNFPNVSFCYSNIVTCTIFVYSFMLLIIFNIVVFKLLYGLIDTIIVGVVLQTKVEIVVTEGDQEGAKIAAMVREIGASSLVVGLHDQSFLFK
jgi:nucleotide-binding universal stress UspA family protein